MKNKTILSLIVMLVVAVFALPVGAADLPQLVSLNAVPEVGTLTTVELVGNSPSFSGGGNGTEKEPFIIKTTMDLNNVRYYLSKEGGKYYFELANNIVFTDADFDTEDDKNGDFYNDGQGWLPIGDMENPFEGYFDGKGYQIIGLKQNLQSTSEDVFAGGLFGWSSGGIYNLGMVDSSIVCKSNGNTCVGGIVGYNDSDGKIAGCFNAGSVYAISDSANALAGGIAGFNGGGIHQCFNVGCVTSNSNTIEDADALSCAGGITGTSYIDDEQYGTIEDCYNTGVVSSISICVECFSGGISGYGGAISRCYNRGGVVAYGYAGGILGLEGGTINSCYYLDNVDRGVGSNDRDNSCTQCSDEQLKALSTTDLSESDSEMLWITGSDSGYAYPSLLNNGHYSFTGDNILTENNFSDENFLAKLQKLYPDGVTQNQAKNLIFMDVHDSEIRNLTGIEYFTGLEVLDFDCNGVSSLDTGVFKNLTFLECSDNSLESIDVKNNTALEFLYCGENNLSSLNVSNNPKLIALCCSGNQLSCLNLLTNEKLYGLTISDQEITCDVINKNQIDLGSLVDEDNIGKISLPDNVDGVSYDAGTGFITLDNPTQVFTYYYDTGRINTLTPVTVHPNIPVTGVTLDESEISLDVNATRTLSATISPDNATNKNVTWTTSDESVAIVDQSGMITGIAPGTATITVTTEDGEYKANCTVKIVSRVIGVSLNELNLTLGVNAEHTLVATVEPENATNKNVTWASSDESIAKVDQSGTITGVAPGWVDITVTTEDGGFIANCFVNVRIKVTGVSLNKNITSVDLGTTKTLIASVVPNDATDSNVTWSSGNPDVCSVDENGNITGNSVGITTITVVTQDGSFTDSCEVTVVEPVNILTSINFPDSNFLTKLQEIYPDGLTANQAKEVTSLDVSRCNISSLEGIESFTGLFVLSCEYNQVTELNVDSNIELTSLYCNDNNLTELDISESTKLINLDCGCNQLTELNVDSNIELASLYCYSNNLAELDISKNTELTSLNCSCNQLLDLDVSNNTELTLLYCDGTLDGSYYLTNLDVSKNTKLSVLGCGNNKLSALDISKNEELTDLDCHDNLLSSLNLSKNSKLTQLNCGGNKLDELDLSANNVLSSLHCYSNKLKTIDLDGKSDLYSLDCYYNQLTSLDINGNPELIALNCGGNQLTDLNISSNTKLEVIDCSINKLAELNITNNTELTSLCCYSNNLAELDVSENTKLVYLHCSDNQLTELNVKNNTELTELNCFNNQLNSMDLSSNINLQNCNVFSQQIVCDIAENNQINLGNYVGENNKDKVYLTESKDRTSDNISYDAESGIVTFADDIRIFTYYYDTGYNNTLMDISLHPDIPITGIELGLHEYEMQCDSGFGFGYTITPSNANTLGMKWRTSNESIATVDKNGNVYAVSEGIVTITLENKDGSVADSCIITVIPKVYVTGISIKEKNKSLDLNSTSSLGITIKPENAFNQNVTWSSDNPDVCSVDTNGNITGNSIGTATITVKTEDGNFTDSCTITVEEPVGILKSDYFPDNNFLTKLQELYPNGLTANQAKEVTDLDVANCNITSLDGIEYFTGLQGLYCYDNKLTALSVSNNTNLKLLSCSDNQLTELNVTNNTELTHLHCSHNKLTMLNVTDNKKLIQLDCNCNKLTELNVSNNTELTSLNCAMNKLIALDLSSASSLCEMDCGYNRLCALKLNSDSYLSLSYNNQSNKIDGAVNENKQFCLSNIIPESYWDNVYLDQSNSIHTDNIIYDAATGTFTFAELQPSLTYYYDINYNGELLAVTVDLSKEGNILTSTNFPDDTLRAYLKLFYPMGITADEAALVETLDFDEYFENGGTCPSIDEGISELTGFEYFSGVKRFTGSSLWWREGLTFDFGVFPQLEYLAVGNIGNSGCGGEIYKIDNNSNLKTFICDKLYGIFCGFHIDFSGNPDLESLTLTTYGVDTLDLSNNPNLNYLSLHDASSTLDKIELSEDIQLKHLEIGCVYDFNGKSKLVKNCNIEKQTQLEYLSVKGMNLVNLDLTNNVNLKYLDCSHNKLLNLGLTNKTYLEYLNVSNNFISSLDLSEMSGLKDLNCASTWLKSLDISGLDQLENLECNNCKIKELITGNNVSLKKLDVSSNKITSLNLSSMESLMELEVGETMLTSLDVSALKNLTDLVCWDCPIETLTVKGAVSLSSLWCSNCNLESLDVSENDNLTMLQCQQNQLSSLDVSHNSYLSWLECGYNNLTSLNIGDNESLEYIDFGSQKILEKEALLDINSNKYILKCCDFIQSSDFQNIYLTKNKALSCDGVEYNSQTGDVSFDEKPSSVFLYYDTGFNDNLLMIRINLGGGFKNILTETYFPDGNFLNSLKELYPDGLSMEEITEITDLSLGYRNIKDLTGIQYFTGLDYLDCSHNELTSVDLSQNRNLKYFDCSYNNLTRLNLSDMHYLQYVNCQNNNLISIDVSNDENLKTLQIYSYDTYDYDLKELNINGCSDLINLDLKTFCQYQFYYLDLSSLPASGISYNYLNSVISGITDDLDGDYYEFDLSEYIPEQYLSRVTIDDINVTYDSETGIISVPKVYRESEDFNGITYKFDTGLLNKNAEKIVLQVKLGFLKIGNIITEENFPDANFRDALLRVYPSGLTSVEAEECTYLYMNGKNISNLKGIEIFKHLTYLRCDNNQLTSLDLGENTLLETLNCSENQLSELNLSKNSPLKNLDCYDNRLSELNLTGNPLLETLNCGHCEIEGRTFFDVSGNICYHGKDTAGDCNQLTELNLSNNENLIEINCSGNLLTTLDVSNLSKLKKLYCCGNNLSNLDISDNSQLTELTCNNNGLNTIDLGNNDNLEILFVQYNNISSLNIAGCNQLIALNCSDNQLESLSIYSPNLRNINAENNNLEKINISYDQDTDGNSKRIIISDNAIPCIELPECSTFSIAGKQYTTATVEIRNGVYTFDLGAYIGKDHIKDVQSVATEDVVISGAGASGSDLVQESEYNCSEYNSETGIVTFTEKPDLLAYRLRLGNSDFNVVINFTGEECTEHKVVVDPAVAATCTETGLTEGSHCETCNEVLVAQEVTPALGHDYIDTTVAPTCTESGYALKTCSRCGESTVLSETAPSGHTLVYYPAVAATGESDGNEAYYQCSACGKYFSDAQGLTELGEKPVIKAISHHFDLTTVVDSTCTEQGYTLHTCTDVGCAESYRDHYTAATGHQLKAVEAVAATCTTSGHDTYWICENCHKLYKDNQGKNEISEVPVTPVLGHHYTETVVDPTCTEQGYTTCTCDQCGDTYIDPDSYVEATGEHIYGDEAFVNDEGEIYHKCTCCDNRDIDAVDEHNMSNWVTIKKSTDDTAGIQCRYCEDEDCNFYIQKYIPAADTKTDETTQQTVDSSLEKMVADVTNG